MTRLSNWKEESDLFEVVTGKMTDEKALKKVDEKKGIKNKIVINPKLTEAIKEIGGELIEVTEEDENGATVDPRKEAEKKSEDQKKKQIENKQKRAQMIKKQVLMKKLIAVRQGSEDIVASHKPEGKVLDEAKVDKGRSDYGKASIRNYRRKGPGHGEPAMFDPENKRGKLIDKRREEHKARRGVKGAKVPAYKVNEDKALELVRANIIKKHGKGAIYDPKKKQSPEDKAKVAAERKKRQDSDNKAYAARAKKAGFKSTQDYTNVVARYGSEDNYKKGRGLGT